MNGKKKNVKRNVIVLLAVVLILIVSIIAYIVYVDLKQEDILRDEVNSLISKDITKDRYNEPIKTKGDYAVVEETIKKYLDDYAVSVQNVLSIMDDDELVNMLSADNYQKDGPDFVASKKYLSTTRSELSDELDKISSMTSSSQIMKCIEDKGLDSYYVELYRELMLNGVAENDFASSQEQLKASSESINNLLDTEEAVIDLLIANKGKWQIENGKIIFNEVGVLNQYNELVKKIA